MKKCNKCNEEKDFTSFIKNKACKDGVAGTCKSCQNLYSKKWKQENSNELSKKRRLRYAETLGVEVKQRELKRRELQPLKVRCQVLVAGMRDRSKKKKILFDKQLLTVNYLIERLSKNPNCECCGKLLDIGYKKDNKFNDNSPSIDRVNPKEGYLVSNVAILCWRCNKLKQDASSNELRMIASFMDVWGNEVESSVAL